MDDRDRAHLELLIEHARAARSYAKAHGRTWWKNLEAVDAVLMRVTQVGEAARKASAACLAEIPDVQWQDVKGIRSKIVHEYGEIDLVIVRGVVARQVPKLITAVRHALAADARRRREAPPG